MKKIWLILLALWKILTWWYNKDVAVKAKREELRKAVNEAIKNDDVRALHRVMSRL